MNKMQWLRIIYTNTGLYFYWEIFIQNTSSLQEHSRTQCLGIKQIYRRQYAWVCRVNIYTLVHPGLVGGGLDQNCLSSEIAHNAHSLPSPKLCLLGLGWFIGNSKKWKAGWLSLPSPPPLSTTEVTTDETRMIWQYKCHIIRAIPLSFYAYWIVL